MAFLLKCTWKGRSRCVLACMFVRLWKRKKWASVSRCVTSIFCCIRSHGQLNFKWSICERRACDQCPNGGNTNVPWSVWCQRAETAADGHSVSVRVSVGAWWWKKSSHRHEDFRFLWWEHAVGKKREQSQNMCTYNCEPKSPSGTDSLHHWMLQAFIEHISCEKLSWLFPQLQSSQKEKQHTDNFVLWVSHEGQTQQSNYKIPLLDSQTWHRGSFAIFK